MAQRKTASARKTKHRPRRFQLPERSLAAAATWSALVFLGMSLLIGLVLLFIPTSALHNVYELVFVNGIVRPDNPMLQGYLDEVRREDALFVQPSALFCGGLTLGALAPRRAGRSRVLWTAALVPTVIGLACLAIVWLPVLVHRHGHLPPGMVDERLVLTQTATSLGGIAAFVLGTLLGLLWRDRRRKPDAGVDSAPQIPAATH